MKYYLNKLGYIQDQLIEIQDELEGISIAMKPKSSEVKGRTEYNNFMDMIRHLHTTIDYLEGILGDLDK